jgi:inosine-uridine nucleoside N-ribohydrolase
MQYTLTLSQGVDDVMALLLALSASPEELELAMISVTYGNVPLEWYVDMNMHNLVYLLIWFDSHPL